MSETNSKENDSKKKSKSPKKTVVQLSATKNAQKRLRFHHSAGRRSSPKNTQKRLRFHHSAGRRSSPKNMQKRLRSHHSAKQQSATKSTEKQLRFHPSAKTWDGKSPERKRFQHDCAAHLERLFLDFWNKDGTMAVLGELLGQRKVDILATMSRHLRSLVHRIERCPSMKTLVPLLKKAAMRK